jgi:hypothetical protein
MVSRTLIALSFFIAPFASMAMVAPDEWTYVFHLEYKNGVLAQNSSEDFFIDTIPMPYTKGAGEGEYTARIVSKKGATLSEIKFKEPSVYLATKQKYVLDLETPYFANADRVDFFSGETMLFSTSLAGTTFCNENAFCNTEFGENSKNCSMDCPLPVVPLSPSETIQETNDISPPPIAEYAPSTHERVEGLDEGNVSRTEGIPVKKNSLVPLVIGILLVLTAITGVMTLKYRKE